PASALDVIAPQLVLRAVQLAASLDHDRGRAGAADADAELLQKMTELGDMRLARGMADLRSAGRTRGREQRRFGPGDRRLVEVNRRRPQAVRHLEDVAWTGNHAGAHRLERLDVR